MSTLDTFLGTTSKNEEYAKIAEKGKQEVESGMARLRGRPPGATGISGQGSDPSTGGTSGTEKTGHAVDPPVNPGQDDDHWGEKEDNVGMSGPGGNTGGLGMHDSGVQQGEKAVARDGKGQSHSTRAGEGENLNEPKISPRRFGASDPNATPGSVQSPEQVRQPDAPPELPPRDQHANTTGSQEK